jgi:tetraacyldisaccharide 4'-kinase
VIIRRLRGRWREELPASPWRWLLLPAWLAWRPLVALRDLAFDRGWRRPVRLGVPVWSVGNLTAGGTGKTPLTRYLAQWALARGLRPAIVTRGYRAAGDGRNDEARLVAECPVVCQADRVAGGRTAITGGATCLILDDGFQHRRLHRDVDLVLIDATRPWGDADGGSGATLPLGYRRERRAALRRADVLVLTRCAQTPAGRVETLRRELALFGKPVVEVVDADARLRPLAGGDPRPVADLRGRRVVLVSALGNPLGFERAAEAHGWQVVESLRWCDHHHYDAGDVATMGAAAAGHDAVLVTTGKDAVKLAGLVDNRTQMLVLEVDVTLRAEDRPVLDRLLAATLPSR